VSWRTKNTNSARSRHVKQGIVSLEGRQSVLPRGTTRLREAFVKYKFGFAAFLIPLCIRAMPEIIVGPYPVGWDTIAFYVPNTLDWAAGRLGWTALLGTAPLLYMISVPAYLLTRVNPVWIFKIMGPVLYGSMILALYRFLRLGIRWTDRMSLGCGLMTALYFVTLRISWDLYRNMLGLTFILLALSLLQNRTGPRKAMISTILLLLAVASDQLTGVLALVIVGTRLLWGVRNMDLKETAHLIRIGILPATFFGAIVYAGQSLGQQLVAAQPSPPGIEGVTSTLGFLVYAFLPILPLALLGIRKTRNSAMMVWMGFCTLGVLVGLMPLYGVNVSSYRWALLLDLPVCICATLGLFRLFEIANSEKGQTARILARALPGVPLLFLLGAGLYIALPAQDAMPYYAAFPGFVPTSMIQDSVPLSDMSSLREVLGWVATQIGTGDVLITHQAIYGWARAYLPPDDQIINYGYSSPLEGVAMARLGGYSGAIMIWWVNGSGWHGQPTVPEGFALKEQKGELAAYFFVGTNY